MYSREMPAGTLVIYDTGYKMELGVVKRYRDSETCFVWYHLGGTASATPVKYLKRATKEQVNEMVDEFENKHAVVSLFERSRRAILGGKTDDLIDIYLGENGPRLATIDAGDGEHVIEYDKLRTVIPSHQNMEISFIYEDGEHVLSYKNMTTYLDALVDLMKQVELYGGK